MNASETKTAAADKKRVSPFFFTSLSFVLLIVVCIVSLLSFVLLNQRLGEIETALSQTQDRVAALREMDSRLLLSLDDKAGRSELESFVSQFDSESASFLKAIAHRGLSTAAPENTLPAFLLAYQAGFRYVEVDIRFTSDGYAVCLHDDTVDRTSNGSGPISAMTLEDARQLDFGSWMSEAYTGTLIPGFDEFLVLCRDLGLCPYVELKAGTQAQIRKLVRTADAYGIADKITWISFDPELLYAVEQTSANARLGYLVNGINDNAIRVAGYLQNGKNRVFLSSNSFSEEEIALCRESCVCLEVWSIDDELEIEGLDPYISGVTSNSLRADLIAEKKAAAD